MRQDSTVEKEGRLVATGWGTAFGSFLGLILSPSTLAIMSFGLFSPFLREEFGWTIDQVAFGATLSAIMVMLVAPLQGVLIDRFGARPLVLLSIPLFGAGFAALAFQSGELWQFYLAWILLPLLGIGLWPGSYAKATATWFTKRLGLAVAIATSGVGVGLLIIPFIINWVESHYDWRTAYLALGLGSVFILWPSAYFFVKENRTAEPRTPSQGVQAITRFSFRVFCQPVFLQLGLAFFMLGFFSSMITAHQVEILMANGESRQGAVSLQASVGLAVIVGRLLAGYAIDRSSVNIVMATYAALALVGTALFISGATGAAALCAAILGGLMVGAEIDVMAYVAKSHFSIAIYGVVYGTIFSLFQLGSGLGATTIGIIAKQTGAYDAALVLVAIVLALAGVLFATLPKPSASQ